MNSTKQYSAWRQQ